MLILRSRRASVGVSTHEVKAALLTLSPGPWAFAISESQRALASTASLDDSLLPELTALSALPYRGYGDFVFASEGTYYLLHHEGRPPFLEVGIVKNHLGEDRLLQFAEAIERAVAHVVAKRGLERPWEWTDTCLRSNRLEHMARPRFSWEKAEFERAVLDPAECDGATALEAKPAREILKRVLQLKRSSRNQLLSRKKTRATEELALASLVHAGLLVVDPNETPGQRSGKAAREHYIASDLGKQLASHSRWMTIAVTRRLVAAGLPIETILWESPNAKSNLDLVTEILGTLWYFELKDREFGAGDVHHFHYRRGLHGVARAFIITTERISPDAKFAFDQLSLRHRGGTEQPTFIEGLEMAYHVLSREIEGTVRQCVARKLAGVSVLCGIDLLALLERRHGPLPGASQFMRGMQENRPYPLPWEPSPAWTR